jgi:DNA mismatch endonuclease (patch repair protein)
MSDNLSAAARTRCMKAVRTRDTDIEGVVRSELFRRGLRFRKHVKGLPGKPDVVFPRAKVAVFIDGDFWHGYQFPKWGSKLSPFWQGKIAGNRKRDQRNFRTLRRAGWRVLRVWKHEVKLHPARVTERIITALKHAQLEQARRLRDQTATGSRGRTAIRKKRW